MKRALSLILVLVLVLGSFPVFAADATYGEMLFDMGLVKGDEEGNLNEDATITRAEMMVVLARMYGVEDEAMAFPLNSTFTDVDADEWYAPYVAYAQVNGWTTGYGDGTFGPMDTLNADMAATFLLRTLGYNNPADFAYEEAVEFAATLGIDVDAMFGNEETATRGEVFELMYDTLNTETTDGVLLGEVLGVMAPAMVEELEVVEINVLNLVEVEVVFNTELDEDSAEDAANYTFDADHDFVATLQADGMTVVLSLYDADDQFDNQEEFTLEIDGVMSVDEELTIEEFVSDDLTAFDASVPKALGVELTGPKTFDITFSEPVQDLKGEFTVEVENGVYGSTFEFDGAVVTVTLGSDLDEGSYEVEVTDAYDYAEFKAMDKTFTLEFVEDTTAPVAVVDSADETEVVLLFDEDVFFMDEDGDPELDDSDVEDFFYHSYTAYNPDMVAVDGEEVTLSFNDNPLPEGTVKLVVNYDANSGSIEDAWGNAVESNIVFFVEVVVDDVAPVVTALETEDYTDENGNTVDLEQDEFALVFSEALNTESFDDDNVVVLDDEDDEVDVDSLTYVVSDDDEYFIVVEMDEDIEGTYTVTVEGYEDDSLLGNEMDEVTLTLVKDDETDPALADITAEFIQDGDDAIVYIMFGEDMATEGSYSVLDPENYMFDVDGVKVEIDLDDDSLELFGGSDTVKIVLENTDLDNNDFVEFARLADAAGNKTVELYDTATLTEVTAPVVTLVTTIDSKHLEITVDGELSTVKADGFEVVNAGATQTFASVSFSYDSDDDETTITATLKSDTQLADPADVPEYLFVLASENKDDKGQYMTDDTVSGPMYITDGYAPSWDDDAFELVNEDYEMTTYASLVLEFDEMLDSDDTYVAADFEIEVDGDVLVAFVDYDVTISGDTVTVNFAYDVLEVGDDVDVTVEDANYLMDAAGNAVEDFDLSVDVVEAPAPL